MRRSAWLRYRHYARQGWPAGFPIAQWPNLPLIVALTASVTSRFTDGVGHAYASAVFYVALGVWAYEEWARGVNWFRRMLGLGFSIYVLIRLASALHG